MTDKKFKRGDYVSFTDLLGYPREGLIIRDWGALWMVRSNVKFKYLEPVEINGRITSYRTRMDNIDFFVYPTSIVGVVPNPLEGVL